MRLLSPFLRRVVYPVLGKTGYFHSQATASASVITYHGVLPVGYRVTDQFLDGALVSTSAFRSHLRLLKKYYNVISPDDFVLWLQRQEELPPRAMLLTCDDGLLNHLTVMLPILQEEGLQCVFFVTPGPPENTLEMMWYVSLYLMLMEARGNREAFEWQGIPIPGISADIGEKRGIWLHLMKTLSRLDPEKRTQFLAGAAEIWGLDRGWIQRYLNDPLLRQRFQLLRSSEIKQLADAGMTIGAHTMSHPVLAEESEELARREITECRHMLAKRLSRPVWALAFPFGDRASVGAREYRLAEEAGYSCAFLNVAGAVDRESARFSFPRVHVTADMSLSVYEAHVSSFHHSLQSMVRS